VDIFVQIPGFLEDLDHLTQNLTKPLYQQLVATYIRIDAKLTDWLQSQAPIEHLKILQARGYTDPTAEGLAVGQIISLFWAMCILVHSTMHQAVRLSPSSFLPGCLSPRAEPRQYCNHIADIVEIFLQPQAGIFGMQAVPFPVGIALEYLMSTEGYGSDVSKKLVGYFADRGSGVCIGNFLLSSRKEWMDRGTQGN